MKAKLSREIKRVITKSQGGIQDVIRDDTETPSDVRKISSDSDMIGVSMGITKNMGNYESLRIEVWTNDKLRKGESKQKAAVRLSKELVKIINTVYDENQDI